MAPIVAVVLDGVGTWSSGYMIWDDLNADWSQYGSQEIRIDYTTFHGVEITYEGLVQSGADQPTRDVPIEDRIVL